MPSRRIWRGGPKESSEAKCKVPHLGWGNPKHKCRLGDEWMESCTEQKPQGPGGGHKDGWKAGGVETG